MAAPTERHAVVVAVHEVRHLGAVLKKRQADLRAGLPLAREVLARLESGVRQHLRPHSVVDVKAKVLRELTVQIA